MPHLVKEYEPQENQQSYVGGKPSLPAGTMIPTCQFCSQAQTFMFQIAFPAQSIWNGRTLACFACTRCANEDFLIPEMLTDARRGCNIPAGFLTSYARNFAFLVFRTEDARLVDWYAEQVAFLGLRKGRRSAPGYFGKIGGTPKWLLDDESPASYQTTVPMGFLMELSTTAPFRESFSAAAVRGGGGDFPSQSYFDADANVTTR